MYECNFGFLFSYFFIRVLGVLFCVFIVIDGFVFLLNRSFFFVFVVFEVLSWVVVFVLCFCARSLGFWTFDVSLFERFVVFVLFIFR